MRSCWCNLGGRCLLGEKVGDYVRAKTGEDEVSKVKFNVVGLVCPSILFWLWVEELYVRM